VTINEDMSTSASMPNKTGRRLNKEDKASATYRNRQPAQRAPQERSTPKLRKRGQTCGTHNGTETHAQDVCQERDKRRLMRHQRSPSATNKALSTNGHRPATPLLSSYREVPTLVISIPTRHTSSTPSQLHTIYSTTLPLASPLRDPRNTNTMQWMAHTM